jgi:hypothetical protein
MDKRILLRHSGSYVFCLENQEHLLNTIGPMYLEQQKNLGKVQLVDTSAK